MASKNLIEVYAKFLPTAVGQFLPSALAMRSLAYICHMLLPEICSARTVQDWGGVEKGATYGADGIACFSSGAYVGHLSCSLFSIRQWSREGVYLPLRSVDTPLANRPLDATAREPPRSTIRQFSHVFLTRMVQARTYMPLRENDLNCR